MIRYSIFLLTIVALAVFSLSKFATAQATFDNHSNVTIVYKTALSAGKHPVVLECCAKEDRSDTTQ
jgi:hypothetical protein